MLKLEQCSYGTKETSTLNPSVYGRAEKYAHHRLLTLVLPCASAPVLSDTLLLLFLLSVGALLGVLGFLLLLPLPGDCSW